MSKDRIVWVDVVKGLLIITVILGHSIQEPLKAHGLDVTENFWRNLIYSFHMPAFMAVSGFLAFKQSSLCELNDCLSSIYKKFKQLIIPFLLWSIPLFFAARNVDHITEYLIHPNLGYWYFWSLFFITVIFTFADYLSQRFRLNHILTMVTLTIGLTGVRFLLDDPKFLGFEYTAYYFVFFLIGYYIHKYQDKLTKNQIAIWSLFVLWLVMACFWKPDDLPIFLVGIDFIPFKVLQLGYRMLTPIIFILWMFSVAPHLKKPSNHIISGIKFLGVMSLGIYASHMVVKIPLAKILYVCIPSFPIWSHVIIEFVILTLFAIVTVWVLRKWSWTSKYLLGKF